MLAGLKSQVHLKYAATVTYFFLFFCRVDYTDALGRTRRCMKKDLSHVQSMVSSMQQTRPDKTSGMDGVTGCQSDSKPSTSSSGGVSIYTIPRDDFRFI